MNYIPLYNRYSKAPAGWVDNEYDHYYELSVSASQNTTGFPLKIEGDADFYWRGLLTSTFGSVGGGNSTLLFRDSFGNYIQSAPAFEEDLGGGRSTGLQGAFAVPLFPEIYCPKNGNVYVDIKEILGGSMVLEIILVGVQRRPQVP